MLKESLEVQDGNQKGVIAKGKENIRELGNKERAKLEKLNALEKSKEIEMEEKYNRKLTENFIMIHWNEFGLKILFLFITNLWFLLSNFFFFKEYDENKDLQQKAVNKVYELRESEATIPSEIEQHRVAALDAERQLKEAQ